MTMLAWGAKVSPEFRTLAFHIAELIHYDDPSWLMAAIAFESGGTFSPSVRNASSGATGLIQFMPKTALRMGYTLEQLAAMTAEQQMAVVLRYFQPYIGRIKSLSDLYMAILWPTAIGKPEDAPLFSKDDADARAYMGNRGLDVNADGVVTKAEAAAYVQKLYTQGMQPGNVHMVEVEQPAAPIDERPVTPAPPQEEKKPMLPFLIPALIQLIPQIAKILIPTGGTEVSQRNQALANIVVDTVVKSASEITGKEHTPASAIEAMSADPALLKQVTQAVVTQPQIMDVLEVGGGVEKARANDLIVMQAEKPFWKASAVFWISMALLPLVYWFVGSIIVGGVVESLTRLNVNLPNWVLMPLSLFGSGWTGEARSGAFNLVIGLVLGGICGVYFGVSVTQGKQQQTPPTVQQQP